MKRIIKFAAILAILSVLVTLPAMAAGSGSLSLTGANAKAGETVTLTLGLDANPGLTTLRVQVTYDSSLQLLSVSDTGLLAGWVAPSPTIASPYTLFWKESLTDSNNTKTGAIATLTFQVLSTASYGEKAVTVSCLSSSDKDGGKNTFTAASSAIFVQCSSHSFGAWMTEVEPTCEAAGEEVRTCTKCGVKETRQTAASGHDWKETSTTDPTCTKTGTTTYTCTRCGAVKETSIPALGHDFGEWKVTKEATCEAAGERVHTCDRCGTRTRAAISALGHDFVRTTTTLRQPTLFEPGLVQGECTRCKAKTEIETVCRATDMVSGIALEVDKGAYAAGSKLKVTEIDRKNEKYETMQQATALLDGAAAYYDIDVQTGGASVPVNGLVIASFPAPEGFGKEMKLYHISEDGELTEIPSTTNVEGTLLTATLTSFGTFALVDPDAIPQSDEPDPGRSDQPGEDPNEPTVVDPVGDEPEETGSLLWLWITLGAIGAAAVIAVIVIVIVKTKKKKEEPKA